MTITICPFCHTGRLERRAMTYIQWHGESLLVVNRMPAIVCDVCGERAYDDRAVEHLQRLLLSDAASMVTPRSYHLA
jgi:YgiT-type zinc finger domain-containing protein